MARSRKRRERSLPRGFTLLELLVALSILSVVMVILYLSIGSTATQARHLRDRLEQQEATRLALQRIILDLEGAFVPPSGVDLFFEGTQEFGEAGRADRLEFISAVHPWARREYKTDDLLTVSYSLASRPGKGERVLVRKAKPLLGEGAEGGGDSVILLEGVTELAFEYLDRQGEVREVWSTRAGEKQGTLPSAVRVILSLGTSGERVFRISALVPVPVGMWAPLPPEPGTGGEGTPGGTGSTGTGGASSTAPPPSGLSGGGK